MISRRDSSVGAGLVAGHGRAAELAEAGLELGRLQVLGRVDVADPDLGVLGALDLAAVGVLAVPLEACA